MVLRPVELKHNFIKIVDNEVSEQSTENPNKCFLRPLGIQLRKRRVDEEQHRATTLKLSSFIRTEDCDNAALVVQGISSTWHTGYIFSAA